MSMIPFLFHDNDWLHHPDFYHHINPMTRYMSRMPTNFGAIMNEVDRAERALKEGVKNSSDTFSVAMDVKGFKPNELKVTVADRVVTVTGSHEERQDDHGYISRSFTRRYTVPEGILMDKVTSNITSAGLLNITAPKIHSSAIEAPKEVEVQVLETK